MRSGLCAHLEPAGDAPGSAWQRHWLSRPAPGLFMVRGPRVGTRSSPGPDVPRHGGLFRKIPGKVGHPASCQEGGCAAQGMVWKWHGVMVLGRVVMLGCWGTSLYRGNSEVKPAIFKWNCFSCGIYRAVWLQLGAVAAWVGAIPSLQGCERAAARGSWGTSLGGVCLVCSSWKIHPGARSPAWCGPAGLVPRAVLWR